MPIDAMPSVSEGTRVRALPVDEGADVPAPPAGTGPFEGREILYSDLLNALPAAVYTTDAAGRITYYNDAAVEFAGRRPVLGRDEWSVTWRLYHADGRPMPHDECPMALALKEGRAIRGEEAVAERPDGSRVWFMPFPTPLRDERGGLIGAVNVLVDITQRKEAESRQALLAHEVNHRANNLLAVMQAILRLTDAPTVRGFKHVLEGRLSALARAHNLLAMTRWSAADLQRLVCEELAPWLGAAEPRVWITGPILDLRPEAAQAMAIILHELASNGARHGALRGDAGEVRVEWRGGGDRFVFAWTERVGGPRSPVPRRGVGLKVLEGAVAQVGGAVRFDWADEGLSVEISAPWPAVVASPNPAV